MQKQKHDGRPGPKAKYRGKDRSRMFSVMLTPRGWTAFERGLRRSDLSRIDYIEDLIRQHDPSGDCRE
jgi:hypothetical protein